MRISFVVTLLLQATRIAFLTGKYPYRYGLHEHVLGPQERQTGDPFT